MAKATFVYVIYIASEPQTVWKALLEGQFTRQYWGRENVSDWKEAGSEMQRKITEGWPRVLSSLKSLLETGRPLPTWAQR